MSASTNSSKASEYPSCWSLYHRTNSYQTYWQEGLPVEDYFSHTMFVTLSPTGMVHGYTMYLSDGEYVLEVNTASHIMSLHGKGKDTVKRFHWSSECREWMGRLYRQQVKGMSTDVEGSTIVDLSGVQ